MLIYELNCEAGHTFEGWFDSFEDLKIQLAQGKITCPVCGSAKVRRVPSAFALNKSGNAALEQQQAQRAMERAVQNFFIKNFEDVGANFFNEALKIHYGAAPLRNIRGVSTGQEEEVLREEGVDFFKFNDNQPQETPAKPGKPAKPDMN